MPKREPTSLEKLFAERLRVELEDQKTSANGLAKAARKRGFKLGQRSVSRMLELKQAATLQKLHEIAETLGVPAWYLLTERDQVQQRVISPPVKKTLQTNVLELPSPYPKIFGKRPQSSNGHSKARKIPNKK